MTKITLTNLVNLQNETTAVNAINNNNDVIEAAFDNTLSRDGTSPNQMGATLDMNSNRIVNLPVPVNDTEPLRKGDLTDFQQFQNSVDLAAALAQAQASATASGNSATASANSATNSATSATNAANSATTAGNSATAAANSATQAASFANQNYVNIFSIIPTAQQAAIINGTTTYDAGPDINTGLTQAAAAGQALFFPKGTYLVQTPVVYTNPTASGLVPGISVIGSGKNATIFKNQVAGAQLTGAFTTTIGSGVVQLNWPNHGLQVGDNFTLFNVGSHSYGGLDFGGDWGVTSVINANKIQFNHYQAATSSITDTGTVSYTKAMMTFGTAGSYMVGFNLEAFKVQAVGTPIGNSALRANRIIGGTVDNVWVDSAVADGLCFPCVFGDPDSTSQMRITNCRFANCGRWGLQLAASSTTVAGSLVGHNEISNVSLENVTIDGCGYNQFTYKDGGGMKWKGQVVFCNNLAFTTNTNCAVYIVGGAGLPSVFNFSCLVLENNTGKQMVVEGLDTMVGQTLEIYNNNGFVATAGLYMDGTTSVVKNINIQSSIIRATNGNNPYTAFTGTGANFDATTTRIYTPSFQNFGFPGQTQVTGFTFKT